MASQAMHRMQARGLLLVVVLALGAGCGTELSSRRVAEPLPLPSGEPGNDCEREDWLALVPSRVEVSVTQGSPTSGSTLRDPNTGRTLGYYPGSTGKTGSDRGNGLGLYYWGDGDLILLEDIWSELDEPQLELRHTERIERVQRAELTSNIWMGSAFALTFGGLAVAIGGLVYPDPPRAPDDYSPFDTGSILVLSGLSATILGGLTLLGYLYTRPSPGAIASTRVRERLLLPREDDMEAAKRGVERHNRRVRARCRR